MPKAPAIFFNYDEWDKLEEKIKKEGYPSKYAYIKDLVLGDLYKDDREDFLEHLCDKLGLGKDGKDVLMRQAWKEFLINHGLLPKG